MATFDPLHYPVPDDAHKAANIFLGVTSSLYIISIAAISTRIILKLRSSIKFGWEDYLLFVGFLVATVYWAILTASIAWCSDYNIHSIPWETIDNGIKLDIIAIPLWGFAIGFVKMSVICLLLRFQQNHSWRIFLYFMLGLMAAVTVGSCIFASLECIPLTASWDPTHVIGAKCVKPGVTRGVSNFVGGFSIATDIVLSLFPMTFLVHLRRPFIEKVLISILMGIGLTASAASITKAVFVQKWTSDPTNMYFGYIISTCATAEVLIGCTAACLPYLKSPIQILLTKCGIDFDQEFSSVRFWQTPHLPEVREQSMSEDNLEQKSSDNGKESVSTV